MIDSSKDPIVIVCASDNNYASWCGVLLSSICKNSLRRSMDVFVMTSGMSEENFLLLKRMESLYDIRIHIQTIKDEDFQLDDFKIYPGNSVTKETFFRLFITKLLPKEVHKAIYLDVDMLCLGDIGELWNTDVTGYAAAVCDDLDTYKEDWHKRLRLSSDHRYFCAGMMVLNLDYWRENDILSQCIAFNRKNLEIIELHDQDILNCVLEGKLKYVSIKWNFQVYFLSSMCPLSGTETERNNLLMLSPSIIHFSTRLKPWDTCCYQPYRGIWRKYKTASFWKNVPLRKNGTFFRQVALSLVYFMRHFGYILRGSYIKMP